MYSFEPSEEQQMLIDAIRRYAVDDLRVAARDADEERQLPPDLIEKGWELGYLQASIPGEYDGSNLGNNADLLLLQLIHIRRSKFVEKKK